MEKKNRYSSVNVQDFDVAVVVSLLVAGCIVAVDVAKTHFYAGIATLSGDVVQIVRFDHPMQTRAFVAMLSLLRDRQCSPQVVMEPTGSYGDSLRHQCWALGVPIFMVSPKHSHDMAEIIDGVPSSHDAKSTVVLAKLHAIRPGRQWEPESEDQRELRTMVDRRNLYAGIREQLYGRLEALMARVWPELETYVDYRGQRSWMRLLMELPGPQQVSSHSSRAEELLKAASRAKLSQEQIEQIVRCATDSVGVPMTKGDCKQLQELVGEISKYVRDVDRLDNEIEPAVKRDPSAQHFRRVVGPYTAAVIIAYLGDPRDYESAAALEKAAGLNLKERSSGNYKGQLRISKRGPGQVRQAMHLSTLRLIQSDLVAKCWYMNRSCYQPKTKLKAVTAVTRKLMKAVWHLAKGQTFDSTKLFDVRRLDLTQPTQPPAGPKPAFPKRRTSLDASIEQVAASCA